MLVEMENNIKHPRHGINFEREMMLYGGASLTLVRDTYELNPLEKGCSLIPPE
jgi:hypothetical protein